LENKIHSNNSQVKLFKSRQRINRKYIQIRIRFCRSQVCFCCFLSVAEYFYFFQK